MDEDKINFIEMKLHFQRSIEILDDLDIKNHPLKNKKLNQALKGIYAMLDKEVKTYNELYEVAPSDTMYYYNVVCENAKTVLSKNLVDKALIESFLWCFDKDEKSVSGILNKVIKNNKL